jgi:UDP-N-acetylmuramoylalanine--D-glutamate ligase
VLLGNIGNPAFHFLDRIGPETRIVFELSSHQLEDIRHSPRIAVLLNLFQEHLDAYPGYREYQRAKVNITEFQKETDFLVYNADDLLVTENLAEYRYARNCFPFSIQRIPEKGSYICDGSVFFTDGSECERVWEIHQDRFLRGEHNLKNIAAAVGVVKILGTNNEAIEDGIATFKGLRHRLEYLGVFRDIHFYDDSIATIPEACMEAMKAVPDVDTLVAGGFDRGIDYSGLARFLAGHPVHNLILAGAAGRRIGEELGKYDVAGKKIFFINRFDDCAGIIFSETRPGTACILSPAAASYDEFNNFEERGDRFRKIAGVEG